MKNKITFFALFSAVFLLAGCATTSKNSVASSADFSGSWLIDSMEKDGIAQQLVLSEISFAKKDGNLYSVTGNSGINRFFGDVTIDGEKFSTGSNLAGTKMAGSPAEMEFENDFITCLIGAEKIVLEGTDGEVLTLYNEKDRIKLSFRRSTQER